MSNAIKIFENKEFGQVRTVVQNDIPMFCLADVCKILEIANPSDAKTRLKEDGVGSTEVVDSLGRRKEMTFVNESNLYKLIFQSRKPQAEQFTEWVTGEVLPSIRRHGGYVAGQEEMNPEELMARALQYADSKIKELQGRLDKADIEVSRLTVSNEIMTPKAEYFDGLVDRNLLTSFRDTAKELGIGEKKFIQFMLDRKYLYRDQKGKLVPYAGDKTEGLFEVKECKNEKTQWAGVQTLVTPRGRETFRLLTQGL